MYTTFHRLETDLSMIEGYQHIYFIFPDKELKYEMIGKSMCNGDSFTARHLTEGYYTFENLMKSMNNLMTKVLQVSKTGVHKITIRKNYSLKEFLKTENKG